MTFSEFCVLTLFGVVCTLSTIGLHRLVVVFGGAFRG